MIDEQIHKLPTEGEPPAEEPVSGQENAAIENPAAENAAAVESTPAPREQAPVSVEAVRVRTHLLRQSRLSPSARKNSCAPITDIITESPLADSFCFLPFLASGNWPPDCPGLTVSFSAVPPVSYNILAR